MSFKQRDIGISEEAQQSLGYLGTGTVFTGHHQFSIFVRRKTNKSQKYLPGRGMDYLGDMSLSKLKTGTDIEDGERLFGLHS
jgi:hypothetical protein